MMSHFRLSQVSRIIVSVVVPLLLTLNEGVAADVFVQVVHGKEAPVLEQVAAKELAQQFERLFNSIETHVAATVSPQADVSVFVGSPETNVLLSERFPQWPNVSDQGIAIQSASDNKTYAVGGGSPSATLWAVHELGHQLGVRHLPRGDLYPQQKRTFSLRDVTCCREPEIRSRLWYVECGSPVGPAAWSASDYRTHLRQLAKMRINGIILAVEAWHPYSEYEIEGVQRAISHSAFADRFPVSGDTVGKKVFGGAKRFENPDFSGITTPAELYGAGKRHIQAIVDAAHSLGMTVGLSVAIHELPGEFKDVFPQDAVLPSSDGLTISPSSQIEPGNRALIGIGRRLVRSYIETYPDIDSLHVRMPQLSDSPKNRQSAKTLLSSNFGVTLPADQQHETVEHGQPYSISGLACLASVFSDPSVLKRADGSSTALVIQNVPSALLPILNGVFPEGTQIEGPSDEAALQQRTGSGLNVKSLSAFHIANDSAGILPQSRMRALSSVCLAQKKRGVDGVILRYLIPGELDASVYMLAQAAWSSEVSAEQSVRELWTTSTGNASAADRLWKAWEHLENATQLITDNADDFARPAPGMLMKHYSSDPVPAWWKEVTDSYTEYMVELYRAQGAIDGDAAPILFDYAKRSEYAVEYMTAVSAVRKAGIAKRSGDTDATLEHLETALEQLHNCVGSLADVTRNQSDRAVIATLNAYAYRPLLEEYERLVDAE